MSLDIGFTSQTPALPGGGSGLGGLGETFSPDLSMGTGNLSVPLDLPNGPNDIGPKLFLRYDSSGANGVFGLGWGLALPRILRSCNQGRPQYSDEDTLILEGSGPLVRLADGSLRPEVETGEWRITALGDGYRVTDRAGTHYELGLSTDSRIPGLGGQTWSWLLHRIVDNLGNTVDFTWREAGAQRYLDKVSYGPFEIGFTYEARPDPLRYGSCGFLLQTDERCKSIQLSIPGDPQPLVRRWDIVYSQSQPNGVSTLTSIQLTGRAADGSELSAPPLQLNYSNPMAVQLRRLTADDAGAMPPPLRSATTSGRVELVDWHGNGLPDVIEFGRGGHARVWPNHGGRWGRPVSAGLVTQLATDVAMAGLVDLNGDGIADIVRIDQPLSGYQPRDEEGLDLPVTWSSAPPVAPGAPNTRLADFSGDGVMDLLWSNGDALLLAHRVDDGWAQQPLVVPASDNGPPTNLSDPRIYCTDMTGDGISDLVRVDGRGVTYWSYLGGGVFAEPVEMLSPPNLPHDTDASEILLVDMVGDGCADVVHLSQGRVRWWANRSGSGFEPPREVLHVPTGAMQNVRVADVFGHGVPAICWSTQLPNGRGRWFALDLLGGARCGLLQSIDNGIGRHTDITYSTSSLEAINALEANQPWATRMPMVLPVVKQIRVTDQISGSQSSTEYHYHDGRFDGVLREMCGFGRVEAIDIGDDQVETLHTTRWFHNGTVDTSGTEPDTLAERRQARAIRGRIRKVERRSAEDSLFDKAISDWQVSVNTSEGTLTPRLIRTERQVFEGAPQPVSRVVTEQLAWDSQGNVTEAREQTFEGLGNTALSELRTLTDYAHDPNGRYRQRVWRVRQFDGNGELIAETRTLYDSEPEGQVGSKGLVSSRSALSMTDTLAANVYGAEQPDFASMGYTRRTGVDGWWIELGAFQRQADSTGIHGIITGPRGGVSELDLDSTGCYPVRSRDALGHELTAVFDLRAYQPVTVTTPSGSTSSAQFDALARLQFVVKPGDTVAHPTVQYDYHTSSLPCELLVSQRTDATSPRRRQREFLDGDGRLLERRRLSASGDIIQTAHVYGARGLLVRSLLPRPASSQHYVAPAAELPSATFQYDALARMVKTTRPDGAIATVRYLPGVIEEADAEDNRTDSAATHQNTLTRRILDANGRVVRIEQQLGSRTVVTTDRFDIKGSVVEHVDAEGAATRFVYDLLGRSLRVTRPEADQIAVLDPAGNIVESRSGSSKLYRRFDLANRLVDVRHDSASAPPAAAYTYHDLGAAPADAGSGTAGGRLVRVDDEAGTTLFDYDERGRISHKTMRPHGAVETTLTLRYRSDELIESIGYPGGVNADYHYNDLGQLSAMPGLINQIEYDTSGRRTHTHFANGVTETQSHDPLTGWLTSAAVATSTNTLRQVNYRHDQVGNLLEISSPNPELNWSYTYDDLYRLIDATSSTDQWTYTYDDAGNISSSSDMGNYTYGVGAPSTCVSSVGSDNYGYNDRGYITAAPWGTHEIDVQGRLRRINLAAGGHEEMVYGHNGMLVRRRSFDDQGAIIKDCISPDQAIRFEDGELILQFTDGARLFAREQQGQRTWLHTDHLGSIVLGTNQLGSVVLDIRYGPYGQVLSRNGITVPQGYATGRNTVAGLVLLGARWYCPQIGRFISPDSIVGDASDPLSWNAYAYARCNPSSYIDPTGRSFWKIFGAILATVAIIAVVVVVSVFTFGIASPGAVALGVGGISVTWGAVFAATMVGIAAGGLIGGIAAARAGGDAGEILLGVLVGGAVGGWAAFGASFAGVAVAGGLGLTAGSIGAGAVAGGISGAINGAAMGFASGFAGGRNNGLKDIMEKVLIGAIVGAALGAALGALSGVTAPDESVMDSVRDSLQPATPSAPPAGAPPAPPATPPPPVNSIGEAASQVASGLAEQVAGAVFPHAAAATAGFTGSIITQTVIVDLGAAAVAEFWDEIEALARTGALDIEPVTVGGDI